MYQPPTNRTAFPWKLIPIVHRCSFLRGVQPELERQQKSWRLLLQSCWWFDFQHICVSRKDSPKITMGWWLIKLFQWTFLQRERNTAKQKMVFFIDSYTNFNGKLENGKMRWDPTSGSGWPKALLMFCRLPWRGFFVDGGDGVQNLAIWTAIAQLLLKTRPSPRAVSMVLIRPPLALRKSLLDDY